MAIKKSNKLTQGRYVKELESLVVFLSRVYQINFDEFFDSLISDQKYTDLYFSLTTIQGTLNRIAIRKISQLDTKKPLISLQQVLEILEVKYKSKKS